MKPLTIEHNGIKITYSEVADNFAFELRGVSCTAKTIGEAKSKINAPPPKIKKPFERFSAFHMNYGSIIEEVEVTSLVEKSSMFRGNGDVWIVNKKERSRSKVQEDLIFPMTEFNNDLVGQIRELQKDIDQRQNKIRSLREKMKAYERPDGYDTPAKQD